MGRAGDITIRVRKTELLDKLKANRETHHELYEKAFAGYRKAMQKTLEHKLDAIKRGHSVDPYLRHTAPEDHTDDYTDVIDMLEMDVDMEVELTQSQFRCYVKDDWDWSAQWTTTNTAYLNA